VTREWRSRITRAKEGEKRGERKRDMILPEDSVVGL